MELRKYIAKGNVEKIGERTYRAMISDDSIDRHDSIVDPAGWVFENFMRNPIIHVQHDSRSNDLDTVIGKALKIWVNERRQVWMDFEVEPEDINPLAAKAAKKLDFGSLRAFSVGFNPLKWSKGDRSVGENPDVLYFRSQDLLEVSLVKIPSNPNATPSRSFEADFEDFVKMAFEEGAKQPETPKATTEKKELNPDVTEYLRLLVR